MPKPSNLDPTMMCEPKDGILFPPPLSLKRNEEGFTSEYNLDDHDLLGKSVSEVPDCDAKGAYYGLSIRKGPYMLNKQEDRVIASTGSPCLMDLCELAIRISDDVPRMQPPPFSKGAKLTPTTSFTTGPKRDLSVPSTRSDGESGYFNWQ